MATIIQKIDKFLHFLKPPRTLKQVRRLRSIGFCQFHKAFIPRLAEKLLPFYQLLKSDNEFVINCDNISTIEQMKKELKAICDSSLCLPKKGLQYVILADASFYAAGYVLMVEDYTITQINETKQCAQVCFGSRVFQPAQMKLSIYAKELLAVHFVLDNFAHLVWGAEKPLPILTDNKSLTRFFKA